MSTSLQWEAPAAGIRLFLSKATIRSLAPTKVQQNYDHI